jgi:hypothetical protein
MIFQGIQGFELLAAKIAALIADTQVKLEMGSQ